MAANFWNSKHRKKWLKPNSEIENAINNSPDSKYLTHDELFAVKYYFTHVISVVQIVAKKVNLSQKVVATASTFFRRLYFKRNFTNYDPLLFSISCLYLSSKLEECALHQGQADVIIHAVKSIIPTYPYDVEDLLSSEYYLLEELEFDLVVFHPYQPLHEYLVDAKLENCTESTWAIINDSYKQTDLCLTYPPYIITLACMFVAAMYAGKDVLHWFACLNIDMKTIGEVASYIVSTYELFEKITKEMTSAALDKVKMNAPPKSSKPAWSGVRMVENVANNVNNKTTTIL